MYDADISYGMTVHPWRKILDQCFVTGENAYLQCGGFKPEFGHFAEWALAANYHALGMFLGYLPEACFNHQYIGELGELRRFSLDFARGEIRYLAESHDEPGSHLVEMSDEWIDRGNLERPLARTLLKATLWDALSGADNADDGSVCLTARRWLGPAIFGDRLRRIKHHSAQQRAMSAFGLRRCSARVGNSTQPTRPPSRTPSPSALVVHRQGTQSGTTA